MQERLSKRGAGPAGDDHLSLSDFGGEAADGGSAAGGGEDLFADIVGSDAIVARLREYQAIIKFAKASGQEPRNKVAFNFLFVGNPGTGACCGLFQ